VAGKYVSDHHRHSAWQRAERQRVYGDAGMVVPDRATADVWRYRGNRDEPTDGEYIFRELWGT
jgi:hypothetical protein